MLNAMNDNGKHFLDNLSIRRARRLPASMSTGRAGTVAALVPAVGDSLFAPPTPPDRNYAQTSPDRASSSSETEHADSTKLIYLHRQNVCATRGYVYVLPWLQCISECHVSINSFDWVRSFGRRQAQSFSHLEIRLINRGFASILKLCVAGRYFAAVGLLESKVTTLNVGLIKLE